MIYYHGDGSVIWRDWKNGGLYKLNSRGEKTKICPDEECREDIDGECDHLHIGGNFIYSNGYLYFPYGGSGYKTAGAFVYRFNLDICEYEKLIEFQGVSECELALNGRYLYAEVYNWDYTTYGVDAVMYKADLNIIRIDLSQEAAVVLYSDMTAPENADKISGAGDFLFADYRIIMPVNNWSLGFIAKGEQKLYGSMINICDIDMYDIATLIEFGDEETIRDLCIYENDIYFMSEKGLSRVSMDMYDYSYGLFAGEQKEKDSPLLDINAREIVSKDVDHFSIDGDFLYYTLKDESTIYRLKLDYTRELVFETAVDIYTPETGEYIKEWKVYNEYLYISTWNFVCYRQKLNSNSEPYIFYELH